MPDTDPAKIITAMDRAANVDPCEAERYYRDVHTTFIASLFRRHTDAVQRYVTNRAVSGFDTAGGFHGPVDAWRWVVVHHSAGNPLPAGWKATVSHDHTRFVENLRTYLVADEQVLLDRRSGQTTSAKMLFTYGSDPRPWDDEQVVLLTQAFEAAPGARMLVLNRIGPMRGASPLRRPGQVTTDELFPSDVDAVVEMWFDHRRDGRAFTADPATRDLLLTAGGAGAVRGYEIEEEISLDRR